MTDETREAFELWWHDKTLYSQDRLRATYFGAEKEHVFAIWQAALAHRDQQAGVSEEVLAKLVHSYLHKRYADKHGSVMQGAAEARDIIGIICPQLAPKLEPGRDSQVERVIAKLEAGRIAEISGNNIIRNYNDGFNFGLKTAANIIRKELGDTNG